MSKVLPFLNWFMECLGSVHWVQASFSWELVVLQPGSGQRQKDSERERTNNGQNVGSNRETKERGSRRDDDEESRTKRKKKDEKHFKFSKIINPPIDKNARNNEKFP